jgi:DNA-directed RNA polymerase specialized sigma24 family protein
MEPEDTPTPSPPPKSTVVRRQLFPATQWSAISMARHGDQSKAVEGLRRMAVNYWRPLYLYLRKRGESHEDAADSVQGFFEFVFSSGFFSHVDREGGKFRSYLLRSLERWRSRRSVREGAQKRGGRVAHVPLDGVEEMEDAPAVSDDIEPEVAFDRQWASDMVGRAVDATRTDYERRDRALWFETLSPGLPGGSGLRPYVELAEVLGCTDGAVKKAAFDLRKAFASHLKAEIRSTVQSNEDAEEELRYLVSVMGGN